MSLASTVEQAIVHAVLRRSKPDSQSEITELVEGLMVSNSAHESSNQISSSILKGIIAASTRLDQVRIAVTGTGWVGGGVGSVEEAMIGAIRRAHREILLTAYTITAGSSRIIDQLELSAATGIRTKIVVDRFQDQEAVVQSRLRSLASQFAQNFLVYDFTDAIKANGHLHAKTLVVDRRVALVGSANLTFHGMMMAHELAVMVEGPTAELIAGRIDLLIQSLRAGSLHP